MPQMTKKELIKRFDRHIADSGFNCVITVRGRDAGLTGHGVNANTKNGPIYDFIKDSVQYYDAVLNHVKECQVCDPTAILGAFTKRHILRREVGISKTFYHMAMRYKSRFPSLSIDLVQEIQARYEITELARSLGTLVDQLQALPGKDLVQLWMVTKVMTQ
jgi:hypothetical protein